jgi:cycloeucalenol cycloisomerase
MSGLDHVLSPNPARAAVERYWLRFTPVWAGVMGVIMVGGFAERWGDVPCLLLGVALCAGALLPPVVRPHASEAALPWSERAGFKCGLAVLLLAFGLNYTQTPFFFDVLHMHYGFQTTWNIANNPFFLYLISVAYFATYFSLCSMTWRALRARGFGAASWLLAPFVMAFLETALNANPFMTRLFCYDDLPFMLGFGTLAYGMAFVWALPGWMSIDEGGPRSSWRQVAVWTLAALYADLITLDLLRFHVAPRFTTVVEGAVGLRDYGVGCLVPP